MFIINQILYNEQVISIELSMKFMMRTTFLTANTHMCQLRQHRRFKICKYDCFVFVLVLMNIDVLSRAKTYVFRCSIICVILAFKMNIVAVMI